LGGEGWGEEKTCPDPNYSDPVYSDPFTRWYSVLTTGRC
jgi:hypothetical protein